MRETRGSAKRPTGPKPVQKAELSEKHTKLRIFLVIALTLVAAVAISFGVYSYFNGDPGWRRLEATTAGLNCAGEFTFLYPVGEGELSPKEEERAANLAYSSATEEAYQLFNGEEEFEGLGNLATLNDHPNEEVTVPAALYDALALIQESGDRSIYLGHIYKSYVNLFESSDDSMAVEFDPCRNPDVSEEFAAMANYANDSRMMDIRLLGGNKVMLFVAQEYLDFAEEEGLEGGILDLGWMENAFRADYIADAMCDAGFAKGCLSSYDGFIRCLDDRDVAYSLAVNDRQGMVAYPAAMLEYSGRKSFVCYHDWARNESEELNYYQYSDGDIANRYVSPLNGRYMASLSSLTCVGAEKSCAEVLLATKEIYISDAFSYEAVNGARDKNIFSIWCEGDHICYNDDEMKFTSVYQEEDKTYETRLVKGEGNGEA